MAGQKKGQVESTDTATVDFGALTVIPDDGPKPRSRGSVRDRTIATMAEEAKDGNEGQSDNGRTAAKDEPDEREKQLKALSDEKAKLEERLSELSSKVERYGPFTSMLESDPNFVRHMAGYLDGSAKEQQPQQLDPAKFGMEDLDDFDLKEALSNPQSPSAKMFGAVVANVASQVADTRLGEAEKRRMASDAAVADRFEREQFLRANKDVTEEELNKAVEFAKKKKFEYSDLVALYRHSNGELTKRAREEILSQMRKAGNVPMTLAAKGGDSNNGKDPQEAMVDAFINNLKQKGGLQIR